MLTVTTESNYLAKVVKLGQPKKHPNADKLQIWDIDGYEVITDLTSKPGDIKIFFPVECQINDRIISKLNLYSDKTLNSDSTISGYIGKQRRVKGVTRFRYCNRSNRLNENISSLRRSMINQEL